MFGLEGSDFILPLVVLAALVSVGVFAGLFIQRSKRREKYKDIIEKRRKALMEQHKSEMANKEKVVSAKDSVASFFKMQQMFGSFGEKLRDQLLLAGIRDPQAPMKYLGAMIGLPVFLVIFAMIILSAGDKEVSGGMQMMILLGAILGGFFLPRLLVKNSGIKRQEDLNTAFPDALDMMVICVQGGIGIEQAIDRVAAETAEHHETLAEELGILTAEMAMLNDRRTALSDFGRRVGGYGKSFATALIQAEQYGTSISQALKVMSDELREIRMSVAEQKAAALPPKLTVPMIAFFLPALFVVILGPAVINAMEAGVGK